MSRFRRAFSILLATASILAAAVYAGSGSGAQPPTRATVGSAAVAPLKDAKLNIEHNATDRDTGFQGFIDGEGWRRLDVRGPAGPVLTFEARGSSPSWG